MRYPLGLLLALWCGLILSLSKDALAQSGPGPSPGLACNASVVYDSNATGPTQLVAAVTNQTIYICGFTLFAANAVNVELDSGAGVACATGLAKIAPAFQLTAQTGVVDGSPFFRGLRTAQSAALCITTNAGIAVQAIVYYIQQ